MKILLAVDGSDYTKKALAYLVNHEELLGRDGDLVVLNVQTPVTPRVTTMVGSSVVHEFQKEEAEKVLAPIRTFLDRHPLRYRSSWVVGNAADEIVRAAEAEKVHLILMGTRGSGALGRVLLGSVAQRVLIDSETPVLLVK